LEHNAGVAQGEAVMRIAMSLILAALLSGCVPIGIRGTTVPFRGAGEDQRADVAATSRGTTLGSDILA